MPIDLRGSLERGARRRAAEQLREKLQQELALIKEFRAESDRGAAVLAAADLDERLKKGLLEHLTDHVETQRLVNGLGFQRRAHLAFGLGLLEEKEYKDIERINQVRNYFAHVAGRQLGFADDRPTELCVNLEVLAPQAVDPEEDRPRSRYLRAVQHISIHFETRVLIAGRRQLVG